MGAKHVRLPTGSKMPLRPCSKPPRIKKPAEAGFLEGNLRS